MALTFIAEISANDTDTENLVFTGIPQTYTSLRIMGIGNTSYALSQGFNGVFALQFNEDTAALKNAYMRQATNNSSVLSNNPGTFNASYGECGSMSGTTPDSGYYPATYIIDIYNYLGDSTYGNVQYFSRSVSATSHSSFYGHTAYFAGTYKNQSSAPGDTPITSLQLKSGFGNWLRYSKFSLYGRD